MSLYNECYDLMTVQSLPNAAQTGDTESIIVMNDNDSFHQTIPSCIKNERIGWLQKEVYYISDLHLSQHIVKNLKNNISDSGVRTYIHGVVLQLFEGEFGDTIRKFQNPIVFFGGDISACFSISEIFYRDFISTWEQIVDAKYSLCSNALSSINKELESTNTILLSWIQEHPHINLHEKKIEDFCENEIPHQIKNLFIQQDELEQKIDMTLGELNIDSSWESDYRLSRKHTFIFSILGNHEVWDFSFYENCEKTYRKLFEELGIIFLNDSGVVEDSNLVPFIIIGGLGYASMNKQFNADQGIYRSAINREDELKRGEAWNHLFYRAFNHAKEKHCSLVVLSHNPVSDWLERIDECSNCFFFSGHTHKNVAFAGNDNLFIFADNQVGYEGTRFHFKKAILHLPRNPFAKDPDGYRIISVDEYKEYYRYIQEAIPGTGVIEQQIKKYEAHLYVLKQNDYFAFLLSSPRGVYICNGGQIRKIGSPQEMYYYMNKFMPMVNMYLTALSPLRTIQEKISTYIKSIGGSGRIHGIIVDIDFYNHVMVDTSNGTLIFYYSPWFGKVQTYPNIGELVHAHCSELESAYNCSDKEQMPLFTKKSLSKASCMEIVDIKNSPYILSRQVNPLHRLFEKHILRVWNPDLEQNITEQLQ